MTASDGSAPPPNTLPGAAAPGTGGSRLGAVLDWLRSRTDTSVGRLVLLWFRRYFEASRNSGAAASAYITMSVLPAALVFIGVFNLVGGNENAFADRIVTHMKLDGATASLVHDLFGTTANNVAAASVAVAIGFLIWGISIGQLYQDVYARAWRIRVGTASDQLRYTVWFFLVSGLFAVMFGSASELRASGWLVARSCSGSGLRATCCTRRCRFDPSCPVRSSRPSSSAGLLRPRRSGSARR
jgi:nitrogen fixation-related uncharacterized protein